MKTLTIALIGTSLVLLPFDSTLAKPGKGKGGPPAHAGGPNKQGNPGHSKNKHHNKPGGPAKHIDKPGKNKHHPHKGNRFVESEINSVLNYFAGFSDQKHGLPPGLAKNVRRGKALPPGWQKKLQPGYVFTDGIWDAFVPLSHDVIPGVSAVPGTQLYWYDDRIVRIHRDRREVLDVIVVPTINLDL